MPGKTTDRWNGTVSRRRFLRRSAAGLGALAIGRLPQAHAASLTFAPAAFGTDGGSALIWIAGDSGQRVRLDFGTDAALAQPAAGPIATLDRSTGATAAVKLTGLTAGETYYYRAVDAASGQPVSEIGRFKTAPATPRPFTFAFSGDMHESYRPFRLFDVIAGREPDFFLHLGDTVYADQPRKQFTPSVAYYRRKHAAVRRDDHLQRFLGRHLTYAIWDDHETDDGAHGGHPNMTEALQVFREYWPCDSAAADGLYRRFTWSGVDFFILDTRRYRSPQKATEGPEKTLLGAAQKQWFIDGLKASSAPFKFVATSVPFHGGSEDAWGNYRTERDEVSRAIRESKSTGVVFLTADYHLARDWTNKKTGLHEFMAGPIAQFTHYQKTPTDRDRYEKSGAFHYGDGVNFGLIRVDLAAKQGTVEFVGADGKVLHSTQFSA